MLSLNSFACAVHFKVSRGAGDICGVRGAGGGDAAARCCAAGVAGRPRGARACRALRAPICAHRRVPGALQLNAPKCVDNGGAESQVRCSSSQFCSILQRHHICIFWSRFMPERRCPPSAVL